VPRTEGDGDQCPQQDRATQDHNRVHASLATSALSRRRDVFGAAGAEEVEGDSLTRGRLLFLARLPVQQLGLPHEQAGSRMCMKSTVYGAFPDSLSSVTRMQSGLSAGAGLPMKLTPSITREYSWRTISLRVS
jgi:hypothetical protein